MVTIHTYRVTLSMGIAVQKQCEHGFKNKFILLLFFIKDDGKCRRKSVGYRFNPYGRWA
jgi:hypothetical protein